MSGVWELGFTDVHCNTSVTREERIRLSNSLSICPHPPKCRPENQAAPEMAELGRPETQTQDVIDKEAPKALELHTHLFQDVRVGRDPLTKDSREGVWSLGRRAR